MARIPQPWQRKSTGTWHVQINGKVHYLGKNKRLAWNKYLVLMEKRKNPDSGYTARETISHYLQWIATNRATETAKSREPLLEEFRDTLPKKLKVEDIRPFHLQKWIDSQKNWNSTTINDRICIIQAVWSWAKSMGYIDSSPLQGMMKPRRKVRQEYLPKNRWQEFLDLATDEQFRDLLEFCLLTGARAQEIFKLRCEHYDSSRKCLVLSLDDSKGNKRSRVIFLCDRAQEIIDIACVRYGDEGPLFRRADGVPWDRNAVRLRFRRLKREMAFPSLCLTTLRHSFAHYRLTEGQDAVTVAALMGHCDTRMLSSRYGHLLQNGQFMCEAANYSNSN